LNESDERSHSWRHSQRTGLALFALGAILLLLRYFNPFNVIAGWVYFLSGLGNYVQINLVGILAYYAVSSVPMALLVLGTIKYYHARNGAVKAIHNEVVITCVSDNEHFASEVLRYLFDDLTNHNQNEPDDVFEIDSNTFVIHGDEIHVSKSGSVPKQVIKIILESLLDSNHAKYHDYRVIEFGDTITIGKVLPAHSEHYMQVCEICGYFTPYEEELPTHRLTHLRV